MERLNASIQQQDTVPSDEHVKHPGIPYTATDVHASTVVQPTAAPAAASPSSAADGGAVDGDNPPRKRAGRIAGAKNFTQDIKEVIVQKVIELQPHTDAEWEMVGAHVAALRPGTNGGSCKIQFLKLLANARLRRDIIAAERAGLTLSALEKTALNFGPTIFRERKRSSLPQVSQQTKRARGRPRKLARLDALAESGDDSWGDGSEPCDAFSDDDDDSEGMNTDLEMSGGRYAAGAATGATTISGAKQPAAHPAFGVDVGMLHGGNSAKNLLPLTVAQSAAARDKSSVQGSGSSASSTKRPYMAGGTMQEVRSFGFPALDAVATATTREGNASRATLAGATDVDDADLADALVAVQYDQSVAGSSTAAQLQRSSQRPSVATAPNIVHGLVPSDAQAEIPFKRRSITVKIGGQTSERVAIATERGGSSEDEALPPPTSSKGDDGIPAPHDVTERLQSGTAAGIAEFSRAVRSMSHSMLLQCKEFARTVDTFVAATAKSAEQQRKHDAAEAEKNRAAAAIAHAEARKAQLEEVRLKVAAEEAKIRAESETTKRLHEMMAMMVTRLIAVLPPTAPLLPVPPLPSAPPLLSVAQQLPGIGSLLPTASLSGAGGVVPMATAPLLSTHLSSQSVAMAPVSTLQTPVQSKSATASAATAARTETAMVAAPRASAGLGIGVPLQGTE